jgi:hypothetical protein
VSRALKLPSPHEPRLEAADDSEFRGAGMLPAPKALKTKSLTIPAALIDKHPHWIGCGQGVTQGKVRRFDDHVRVGVTFSLPAGNAGEQSGNHAGNQAGGAVRRPRLEPERVTASNGDRADLERERESGNVVDRQGTGQSAARKRCHGRPAESSGTNDELASLRVPAGIRTTSVKPRNLGLDTVKRTW